MNLHRNIELFDSIINELSIRLNIAPSIIEKDYYVTLFLTELNKKVFGLIFKGGTSLSKCFKLINRFSEDIDLTLKIDSKSYGKRRKLKQSIIETCQELGFEIINIDKIRSRRDYNSYEIQYPIKHKSDGIKQFLLVETVFIVKSYPTIEKDISSIIYENIKNIAINLVEDYELYPTKINVQSLERTFVDKIFAICDYHISKKITGHSRHIYDLYCIFDRINFDERIIELIKNVREDRKKNKTCYSAGDNYDINELLKEIITNKTYYNDFKTITEKIIYDNISYDKAISVINKIIELNIF